MEQIEKQKILEELGGIPEEVYDDLVKELIEQSKGEVVQLKELMQANKPTEAACTAHSIKGASANMRITDISEVAKKIELSLKDGVDPATLMSDLEELERRIESFSL